MYCIFYIHIIYSKTFLSEWFVSKYVVNIRLSQYETVLLVTLKRYIRCVVSNLQEVYKFSSITLKRYLCVALLPSRGRRVDVFPVSTGCSFKRTIRLTAVSRSLKRTFIEVFCVILKEDVLFVYSFKRNL